MINDIQRRILAEAAKFGGSDVSGAQIIANQLNEANYQSFMNDSAGGVATFGFGKAQFEGKMRQLLMKMGFEKGINKMDINGNKMVLYFANRAKANDFVITFNGLVKRSSKGSPATLSTSFDKIKSPAGTNAVVTVDFGMMKTEDFENGSDVFVMLEALHEQYISEGAMKAAIEDFMYSIPDAAIKDLKPVMKITNISRRFSEITKVLRKHGFPTMSKTLGSNSSNIINDYYDTFFGESVELESDGINESMNNYLAFYNGKKITVQAETSYKAQLKAIEMFKAPASKKHMVNVKLAGGGALANNESVEVAEGKLTPNTGVPAGASQDKFKKAAAIVKKAGYKATLGKGVPAGAKSEEVEEETEVSEAKIKYLTGPGKRDSKRIIGIYTMQGKWIKDMKTEKEAMNFVNKSWGESVEEAYAHPDEKVIGQFYEKTGKKAFEYRMSKDSWGKSHDLPHEVCVSRKDPSSKGDWRAANVKGTVCYIAVDEGEGGKPVIEKWDIKKHVKYVKAD
jgi:hypothetical protein